MPSSKKSVSKSVSVAKGYPALVKQIREELRELDFFVKHRAAESYWRVGRFIHAHLLRNRTRARYGNQLIERLSQDVDRDAATLSRALKFYRTYPILARGQELSWSHYRALITIKDKEQRKKLEKTIIQKQWDAPRLQEYLNKKRPKAEMTGEEKPIPRLQFNRGRPHTFRLVKAAGSRGEQGEILLDLGFRLRCAFPQKQNRFKDNDRVGITKKNGEWIFEKTQGTEEELFTYPAEVVKIVDGDTLIVLIDASLGMLIEQRLRLRGIDCAEIDTEEGKAAKRFVQSRLRPFDRVVIKTYKDSTDKYDRYLADIFYPAPEKAGVSGETDEEKIAREGIFLNQELLDERLAQLYRISGDA